MRFGRTLQLSTYAPWKDQYIDYAKLKKLLREDESAPSSPTTDTKDSWTDEDESAFVDELVNRQLEKVHAFHQQTYEKLRDRTAVCEAKLDGVAVADVQKDEQSESGEAKASGSGSGKQAVPSQEEQKKILAEVLSELDSITKETNELEKYSRINYTGFLKAAKKHDRKRGASYRVRPLLQVRLSSLAFNKEDYGPLLYRLSAMYSFVRQHNIGKGEEIRGKSMSETQPGKEEYIAYKFWVHPENLLEVKTMILRQLPVLVYNPQTSKVAEGNVPDPSITSIYFDNPGFDLYTNKVDHGEASSLRLRWYGQLEQKPPIWVEKKTVQQDDNGLSHEARLTTKEKYVQRFINGEYHMEKQIQKLSSRAGEDSEYVTSLRSSVEEIQDFIKSNDLQPVLRANYTRTAFQIPGDDRVRISLDTDVAFIREDALDSDRPCRDLDAWHRTDIDSKELEYPFTSIRKGEINRFPFALLEIKLRNTGKNRKSEWINDIMNSHVVKEAPRFSKFVHGVAVLFEDYVNTFPFWLSDMENDIRRDPQQAFEDEQARRRKEAEDDIAVGSLLRSPAMRDTAKKSSSPLLKGTISPIGSPLVQAGLSPSTTARKASNLNTAISAQSQTDVTAGEPDEDETGTRGAAASKPKDYGTLSSLLPTSLIPSTSKYAAHRKSNRNRPALPPGVSKPEYWLKDAGAVKVEGKVWLANQRTFIKWQHVSILLASLGVGLYNAAGENNDVARGLALVYTLVAVFAGAWGYGVYMWRVKLIEGRSGKDFDAVLGPVIVCVGLIIALALNFGFKYQAVMQNKDAGHGGNASVVGWGDGSRHGDLRLLLS